MPGARERNPQVLRQSTPELLDESGKVRVFVGHDPEGCFLELDPFLDVEGNETLLARSGTKR